MGIIVLLIIQFFAMDLGKLDSQMAAISDLASDAQVYATSEIATNWTAIIMTFTEVLFIITTIVTIVWAIFQIVVNAFSDKKRVKTLLITFAIAAVVVVAAYFGASATVPHVLGLDELPTPATCKLIEAGLFITYVVGLFTIVTLVYGEISKIWK